MKSFSVNHLWPQSVNHLSGHLDTKKNRNCKCIVHLEGLVEIEFKLKAPSQRHIETAWYISLASKVVEGARTMVRKDFSLN